MAKNEFKGISDETLLAMLANATKTYYNALGHTKAHYNQLKMENYKKELQNRKVSIPDNEELLKIGQFNGIGTY